MSPDAGVVVAAVFGLIVGSFLNVCIFRLPLGQSVVTPRSRCMRCDRTLRWYENVPVVSWIVLRGRCRTCGERISWTYPLIELCTAAAFAATYAVYGPTFLGVSRLVLTCVLLVLFVIDLQHQILPNVITLPGIVVGLVFSAFGPPGVRDALIGVVLGGLIP